METISIFENLKKAGLNFKELLNVFLIGKKGDKENGENEKAIGENDKK